MHPDRVIVSTYRQLYGISTIPDGPNTLTHQSAITSKSPREPTFLAMLQLYSRKKVIFTINIKNRVNIMCLVQDCGGGLDICIHMKQE